MKTLIPSYRLLFLLLFLYPGISNYIYADDPINISQPQIVPMTPGAAAVQKYVTYPVNYSTGLADITIPLYTIQSGDLELPISISYHSAGIKLGELSGWVGTNWTLNAEPSIMREVRGIPDEESFGGYMTLKYFENKAESDDQKKQLFLKWLKISK